jgi:hypothetical protein
MEMVSFRLGDTADAVPAMTATMEGKVSKSLKSFLKKKFKRRRVGTSPSGQGARRLPKRHGTLPI